MNREVNTKTLAEWLEHSRTTGSLHVSIPCDVVEQIIVTLDRSRLIDGKFQVKDGQIVKVSNGEPIPIEEPLFLFRARDRLALPILQIYRVLSAMDGCNDYHFEKLSYSEKKFVKFAEDYPERMKQPSVTRGR